MGNLGKRIIVIVLILAAVVVLASLWWKQSSVDNSSNLSAVGEAINNGPSTALVEKVSLLVNDQFPGTLIFVSSVELPKGGWVVIHRDEEGRPGAVIGAGYFAPDVSTGEVNLSTETKEGENYLAVLYRDNGDTNFDSRIDQVYRDDNTQIVAVSFKITRDLPENKG